MRAKPQACPSIVISLIPPRESTVQQLSLNLRSGYRLLEEKVAEGRPTLIMRPMKEPKRSSTGPATPVILPAIHSAATLE